jgi:hypothetical protein
VQITKSKWYLPALSVVLGVVMLIAMAIGGDLNSGVISLGIMTAFGCVSYSAAAAKPSAACAATAAMSGSVRSTSTQRHSPALW